MWRDSQHESSAPQPPLLDMPPGWVWGDFLRYMGWCDRDVLDRQEAWFVRQQWAWYGLRLEYGMLG